MVAAPLFPLWTGQRMVFLLDALHQHYAWQEILGRILAESPAGLPGWNPYVFGGAPLLADPQMQVAYPPCLLYRCFPFPVAFGLYVTLHLLSGAAGTFAFLRAVGASTAASLLGGVSFGLGTHAVLLAGCPMVLGALAWLPWCATAAHLVVEGGGVAAVAGLATTLAWGSLAGCPQYILYLLGVVGAVAIGRSGRRIRVALLVGCAVLLGLAIAALVLLPFAAYLPHTYRALRFEPATLRDDAGRVRDLLAYVAPDLAIGTPSPTRLAIRDLWARLHFGGFLVVPLAFVAVSSAPERRRLVTPLLLVIGGSLMAIAPGLPGGDWLGRVSPLGYVRRAALWLVLVDFGLAWLAALGADMLGRARGRTAVGIACAFGVIGLVVTVASGGRVHPALSFGLASAGLLLQAFRLAGAEIGVWILAAVTYTDVLLYAHGIQPTAPARWLMEPAKEESVLQASIGEGAAGGRCIHWPPPMVPGTRFPSSVRGRDLEDAVRGVRAAMEPNLPAAIGVRCADGDGPLVPRVRWDALRRVRASVPMGRDETRRVLRGLAVTHVVADPFWGLMWPRVDGHRFRSPRVEIIEVGSGSPVAVRPLESGSARVEGGTGAGFWRLRCDLRRPAVVTIAETALPGWIATVSGRRWPLRADGFGAIEIGVPAGECAVELRYEPPGWRAGFLVSLAGLGLIIVFATGSLAGWLRRLDQRFGRESTKATGRAR